jgi:hypothetical protein
MMTAGATKHMHEKKSDNVDKNQYTRTVATYIILMNSVNESLRTNKIDCLKGPACICMRMIRFKHEGKIHNRNKLKN